MVKERRKKKKIKHTNLTLSRHHSLLLISGDGLAAQRASLSVVNLNKKMSDDDDPAPTTNLGSGLSALILLVVALLMMLLSSNHNLGLICGDRLGANGTIFRVVDLENDLCQTQKKEREKEKKTAYRIRMRLCSLGAVVAVLVPLQIQFCLKEIQE